MPFVTIPLDGGLDLQTAPQAGQPGALIDCYNYEVALQRGYRRIDGYERFDGGQSPTINGPSSYQAKIGGNALPTVGQVIQFTALGGGPVIATAYCVESFSTSYPVASNWMNVVFVGTPLEGGVYGVVGFTGAIELQGNVPYSFPSVASYLSGINGFYTGVSATIQPVPGQGSVNGLFWLKNKLYATRDYFSASFTTGGQQVNIGDVLYQGASLGSAAWSGTVAAIVLSSGTWTSSYATGNAAGTIMFYNTSGTISNATVNNYTQSANGVLTITGSGSSVQAQAAGLYVATGARGNTVSTQSWQWCDLGWNIAYSGGVSSFINMNVTSQAQSLSAQYQVTPWHTATTPSTGAAGWTSNGTAYPLNLNDNDSVNYIEHDFSPAGSGFSHPTAGLIQLSGFGFTDLDIPPTASITGVEVQLYRGGVGLNTYNYNAGCAITSGQKTLTANSQASGYPFSPAMVGKSITVNGAGAAGGNLVTTIAAYTSPSQVTLTAAAGTTVTSAVTVIPGVVSSIVDKTLTLAPVAAISNPPNFADTTTAWGMQFGASYPAYTYVLKDYGAPTNQAGIPTQMLGYTGITPADIKNSSFGINYTVQIPASQLQNNQYMKSAITQVQMRFSYLPQNNQIYFWNGQGTAYQDAAMTAGSSTLTLATSAPFTASSVGQTVVLAGAGTAGGNLTVKITGYTSAGVVTVSASAVTTVSGATATLYTPVVAQVVQFYNQSGSFASSNAQGVLYLQFIQPNGTVGGIPPRPIGAGETIRTYSGQNMVPDGGVTDASQLLANSSSAAAMNSMDWSALLAGKTLGDGTAYPASKYQSVTKNFYASTNYEAIFGVSGGGPAFYFDGVRMNSSGAITGPGNFSRILTGLPHDQETPRSIEAHQGHIFLGYYSGIVQWSNSDNVLSFDPTLGNRDAGEQGFSDHVTAIKSIQGDALGVWTTKTFQMIQGQIDNPSGVYTSIISPTSGGIEYTVQPMETYMYADFRGIASVSTTNAYGDFQLYHLSSKVASFLTPRLQNSAFIESGSGGVINSVLARAKNQYRLFFNDGYYLTATLIDPQNPVPQYTIGKYTLSGNPITWDAIIAVTDDNGRDRIFASSAASQGVVYELDRGNSFNGSSIPAYVTLVPDVSQAPFQNKQYSGIGIYGIAQDYATFQLSRSNNYVPPVNASGANVIQETFGSANAAVTGNNNYFQSIGTSAIQIEGQALTLRFDSGSGTDPGATTPQFSHVLQALSYNVKPLQAVTQ